MRNVAAFLKIFGSTPWPEWILLCLAVLISYASVWPNEFVFDDVHLIVANEFLKNGDNLGKLLTNLSLAGCGMPGGFYRPIQMLAYFLIYQAFGPSTVAFHALGVSLHALNACLLHHFGIKAGFRKGAVFTAALVWALHPLHTVDVANMTSTAELLWSSFCLLGLITLLPDFTPPKIRRAMIFFVLALGCKESAVVFPALAAITFFFVSKDRMQVTAYLRTWPLWLLAAGYVAAWLCFIHTSGYAMSRSGDTVLFQHYVSSLTNRVLTSFASLTVYARLIVWPAGLHIERFFSIYSTLLAWQPGVGAVLAGLGFLQILWGKARRGLALSFGLLWFAVALSPYTGILIPVNAQVSEGWMYMPTMGLFLGVAQTAAGFFEKRQGAARLLVCAIAVSLGITTFIQNEVWRNPETLYQNILQNGGYAARFSNYLGLYYMEHQEFDKAAEQFQYVIDHSDGHNGSGEVQTHLELAMAWLHTPLDKNNGITTEEIERGLPSSSHIPEAIAELDKVIQANSDFAWAHVVLAVIYRYQGNTQLADLHQKQAEAILQKQGNAPH